MKRKGFLTLLVALLCAVGIAGGAVAYASGGGALSALADAPTIDVSLHGDNYVASPNGKGWSDMKTAFGNALNAVNAKIGEILNGRSVDDAKADLDAAVAAGTIPFYSPTDGCVPQSNVESYGDRYLEERSVTNALIVARVNDGLAKNDTGSGEDHWNRDGSAAFVVYNAKATSTTDKNGVIFVVGKFARQWKFDQKILGMPNAAAFKIGNATYQNFQRGYIKVENDTASTVRYKNIDAQGAEAPANANVSGWYGAMGWGNNNGKNSIGVADEAAAKAFSQKASAYYDSLWERGYNPGYTKDGNRDKIVFANEQIRGKTDYPLENLYMGGSKANPWGGDREGWSIMAYNTQSDALFLMKDEIVFAMDKGRDNNGNQDGICEIGAPASEMFVVKEKNKRYQDFANGYAEVTGTEAQNNSDGLTVHKSSDSGYQSLATALTNAYNTYKSSVQAAYNAQDDYTADSFASFKQAYETELPTNATGIAEAYNDLYDAYRALQYGVRPGLRAALAEVEAVGNNTDKKYTAGTFAAFTTAANDAKAMAETTDDEVVAKTNALRAALTLLAEHVETVPTPTVTKHGNNHISSPNGKSWQEMEQAFNAALAELNEKIYDVIDACATKDPTAALDAAVANGTVPFYSHTGAYIQNANLIAYGESWANANLRNEALLLSDLNDGVSKADDGVWQHRGGGKDYFAAMVFNAKTNGVLFVTGKFMKEWNQNELGMPNADAFTLNGVRYQNFQRGYLKEEGGVVTKTLFKNVKADGSETAADMNGSGWYGAMGLPVNSAGLENYFEKNTVGVANEAEAKAFSAAASAYYDALRASGYNPGYKNFDGKNMSFRCEDIRGEKGFPMEHLYHGDSTYVNGGDAWADRENWTTIAYNRTLNKFFLLKDEIMVAMDKGDNDKGNYQNILTLGAPVTELFAINGKRYQGFTSGYVAVNGLVPQNGVDGLTVYKDGDFVAALTAEYNAIKTDGAIKAAYDKEEDYKPASYAAFKEKFDAALPTTVDGILQAYGELLAAYNALELGVRPALNAAKAAVEAVGDNAGNKYTTDSFTAYTAALTAANAMPEESDDEIIAKTEALKAALALLIERAEMGDLGVSDMLLEVDQSHTFTVQTGGDGEVRLEIVEGDAATVSGNVLTAVKRGTVKVKITKAGGNAYFDKSVTITVTVERKSAEAPATPTVESVTGDSITIAAVEGAEYRLGATGQWQSSNVFTGLEANTEYIVYVRIAETDTAYASAAVSITVSTTDASEKKGCGSATGAAAGGAAAVLLALCGIVVLGKKKARA